MPAQAVGDINEIRGDEVAATPRGRSVGDPLAGINGQAFQSLSLVEKVDYLFGELKDLQRRYRYLQGNVNKLREVLEGHQHGRTGHAVKALSYEDLNVLLPDATDEQTHIRV